MRIFVEELPISCFYCDCCHERDYNPRERWSGEKFCCIENESVNKYYETAYEDILEKPDWCPLEQIPKKKTITLATYNAYKIGKAPGWNSCIEEGRYESDSIANLQCMFQAASFQRVRYFIEELMEE